MKFDKEILHHSHPHHKLKIEYTETPFSCDGCMEAGIGLKYKCEECEFDLHKVCAMAPPVITHHFYKKCEFRFYTTPPGPVARICDACGRDALGFIYHCKKCGFDLHPCCANLPQVLDDGERGLHLCMKLSSSCHRCGRKGLGWCYRSECKSYNLHVSCVKELLVESWQAMYLNVDKNKVREMQTKIPSLGRALDNHHHRKGKVKKCCQIAGGAVRVVVSAILGDPTAIIAAVVGGFMSK
ncbi:Cysteine/Histidine-rich C1 domain-containing protein [Cinnamomum micranthum f. kanehirae]|uniref:Cysteine/Histidine-rich C1 domain-containing protein n=1 Tax=Cinnamomum micranthum f. kanehirae TaxID=337451 RepID=A0A443N2K6_9MAGN|nr:Cysteine/Histidine-rich C1 domain-containing protein [Cinnamomum micranthum f. kanehirae]